MALLLFDLDNTASDRAASLRAWARQYVKNRYGREDSRIIEAIIRADGDGLRPKAQAAADLAKILDLDEEEKNAIIAVLRAGTLKYLRPTPGNNEALEKAKTAGWTPVIVTNGNTAQQKAKVTLLGLEPHIDGLVISQEAGVAKPEPGIFKVAARHTNQSLDGAWMIGDSPYVDIAGATAAGLKSVWMRRGRHYPDDAPAPTASADSFPEAVQIVIDAGQKASE